MNATKIDQKKKKKAQQSSSTPPGSTDPHARADYPKFVRRRRFPCLIKGRRQSSALADTPHNTHCPGRVSFMEQTNKYCGASELPSYSSSTNHDFQLKPPGSRGAEPRKLRKYIRVPKTMKDYLKRRHSAFVSRSIRLLRKTASHLARSDSLQNVEIFGYSGEAQPSNSTANTPTSFRVRRKLRKSPPDAPEQYEDGRAPSADISNDQSLSPSCSPLPSAVALLHPEIPGKTRFIVEPSLRSSVQQCMNLTGERLHLVDTESGQGLGVTLRDLSNLQSAVPTKTLRVVNTDSRSWSLYSNEEGQSVVQYHPWRRESTLSSPTFTRSNVTTPSEIQYRPWRQGSNLDPLSPTRQPRSAASLHFPEAPPAVFSERPSSWDIVFAVLPAMFSERPSSWEIVMPSVPAVPDSDMSFRRFVRVLFSYPDSAAFAREMASRPKRYGIVLARTPKMSSERPASHLDLPLSRLSRSKYPANLTFDGYSPYPIFPIRNSCRVLPAQSRRPPIPPRNPRRLLPAPRPPPSPSNVQIMHHQPSEDLEMGVRKVEQDVFGPNNSTPMQLYDGRHLVVPEEDRSRKRIREERDSFQWRDDGIKIISRSSSSSSLFTSANANEANSNHDSPSMPVMTLTAPSPPPSPVRTVAATPAPSPFSVNLSHRSVRPAITTSAPTHPGGDAGRGDRKAPSSPTQPLKLRHRRHFSGKTLQRLALVVKPTTERDPVEK